MFVRIYKTGYVPHALSIVVITAIIWLPAMFVDMPVNSGFCGGPLFRLFYNMIGTSAMAVAVSMTVLVVAAGLLLNAISTADGISGKTSMLGFFFFVFFIAFFGPGPEEMEYLWASFFMLLMLNTIFKLPKASDPLPLVFNASLFLGIAALFNYVVLSLVLVVWAALMTFRVNSWREYIVAFLGTILPLFFVYVWHFFTGRVDVLVSEVIAVFIPHFGPWRADALQTIAGILMLGLLLPAVMKLAGSNRERNILLRQRLAIVLWLLGIVVLVVLFFGDGMPSAILLTVPAAMTLTVVADNAVRLRWLDMYVMLVLLFNVLRHLMPLFYA